MTPIRDGRARPRFAAAARRAVPAIVGLLVIAGLGLVSLRIGSENVATAERVSLQARIDAVDGLRENAAAEIDPATTAARADTTGFLADSPELNAGLIERFVGTTPGQVAALLDLDGRVISSMLNVELDVAVLGDAWDAATDGHPATSDVFDLGGSPAIAQVVPVGGDQQWGVLVAVQPALANPTQSFFQEIGSLNSEPGGLSIVDGSGRAYLSWSLEQTGEPLLADGEVDRLVADRVSTWVVDVDGEERTRVGAPLGQGYSLVFDQTSDALYRDARAAQRARTGVLFGVLGVSVVALLVLQWRRESAARQGERRLHALLRSSHDLVVVVDSRGRLDYVSPASEGLLGRSAESLLGRPLADLSIEADRDRLLAAAAGPAGRPILNVRIRTADGGTKWFDVESRDLRSQRAVRGVLLTLHEVGERKGLEDELVHQATHDRLTGLPNRHTFIDLLASRLTSTPGRRFAIVYVDLDHFKPVNDSYGHDAGDRVLVTVAERAAGLLGHRGVVSRLGGDEFVAVLDDTDGPEAQLLADELLHAIRMPIVIGTDLAHIDASIGIVIATSGAAVAPEQLIRQADEAMYSAKAAGRGRAVVATGPPPRPAVVEVAADLHASRADPASAPPAATTSYSPPPLRLSERLRSWVPPVFALLIVGGIAALGHLQTVEQVRSAERDRIEHNLGFTAWSAGYYSEQYRPERIDVLANAAPWELDGGDVDAAVVAAFATSPAVGDGAVAVLAQPSGEPLVSHPEGHTARIDPASDAWQAARTGDALQQHLVEDDDDTRSYYLLPIRSDEGVEAILALGISTTRGPGQIALAHGGVEGYEDGGWSLLDASGRIYMSWSDALVGETVADPGALADVPQSTAVDLSDDETVLLVGRMSSTFEPTYLAFMIPAEELFEDLRVGSLARDVSFLGMVAAAVLGLAWVSRRREQAVRRVEERLAAFLANAHDLILVLDHGGRIQFMSSAVEHLLGYPTDHRPDGSVLELVHPADRDRAKGLVAQAGARGSAGTSDVRIRTRDGGWRWFDVHASDQRALREVGGMLLTCHDVSERRALQDQLAERALHDPLTGLPNRGMLGRALQTLVEEDAGQFAVLFVDLDRFKPVNDELGHDAGDVVLREIAERFERNVRGHHPGRERDIVCRLGGDEFAILLRDVDEATARETADRLLGVASEPVRIGDRTVSVGATIGVAFSHPSGGDPTAAISNADAAMYRAKGSNRGTYEVYVAPGV